MIFANQLIQWIGKKALGQEVTVALVLLHLITDAVKKRRVDDVARFVYQQLPKAWKAPKGPATEAEFVDMVQAGQLFLGKIQAIFKPA